MKTKLTKSKKLDEVINKNNNNSNSSCEKIDVVKVENKNKFFPNKTLMATCNKIFDICKLDNSTGFFNFNNKPIGRNDQMRMFNKTKIRKKIRDSMFNFKPCLSSASAKKQTTNLPLKEEGLGINPSRISSLMTAMPHMNLLKEIDIGQKKEQIKQQQQQTYDHSYHMFNCKKHFMFER